MTWKDHRHYISGPKVDAMWAAMPADERERLEVRNHQSHDIESRTPLVVRDAMIEAVEVFRPRRATRDVVETFDALVADLVEDRAEGKDWPGIDELTEWIDADPDAFHAWVMAEVEHRLEAMDDAEVASVRAWLAELDKFDGEQQARLVAEDEETQ
jgi:hypothetical protein